MPDLTLTVTTAQWNRIKHHLPQITDGATATAYIKDHFKTICRNSAHDESVAAAVATVDADLDVEGWND